MKTRLTNIFRCEICGKFFLRVLSCMKHERECKPSRKKDYIREVIYDK